ncbi:LysR family transcriptional regulator [Alkalimonas amylolytica]|uniref:DNA-binding transcriptional regulator, LysR family n=1 Tax=Alkalimonas amylolytica TaxID=152573 RepID=A0A1H4C9K0_ALKAM|nr:LysR family transcriptional regulator [Alkalimonas amylolytica]SEA56979.1 DNA-binding transcriptional regulator, LysR family [Alkalimonas amylolytica]
MDTELLKTFLEVHRTRHFGKAAANLFLTQSAVSSRIRQLEQHLGVTLFSRYRNNIQLTTAGERLLPHAETMLVTLQRARQDVAITADQQQQLVIASTATLWDCYLLARFSVMQRQLPAISWRAESLERESMIRGLLERQLDLALLFDPPKTDDLQVEHHTELKLLPVIHSDFEPTKAAMQANYVLMDWGTAFQIKHADILHEEIRVTVRTNHAGIALTSVLQQKGAAYLPETMVAQQLQQGVLQQVEDAPVIGRNLYAAYLKAADSSDSLQNVLIQLKDIKV